MLRRRHTIAGCRRVASRDLVTGSHGTSGISSTAIVACSGVRSVRVPRIFRLNACHSVAWVRAHRSVTWQPETFITKIIIGERSSCRYAIAKLPKLLRIVPDQVRAENRAKSIRPIRIYRFLSTTEIRVYIGTWQRTDQSTVQIRAKVADRACVTWKTRNKERQGGDKKWSNAGDTRARMRRGGCAASSNFMKIP